MRHAPLVIIALTHVAAADSIVLAPVEDAASSKANASTVVDCESEGLLEKKRLRLDGHAVRVVNECGSSDLNARLVFEVDGGWRTYYSAIIAYQGANMTEAPAHVSLLLERTTFTTLADKRRALVHRVDTLHRNIRMDGTIESSSRQIRVDVCAYADDGQPTCGNAVVECPAKGCKPPRLDHGTLALHAKTGLQKFTIE